MTMLTEETVEEVIDFASSKKSDPTKKTSDDHEKRHREEGEVRRKSGEQSPGRGGSSERNK